MKIFTGYKIFEDNAFSLMCRIRKPSTAGIAQKADIGSITLKVWNTKTGKQVSTDTTLTVASVMFDTLQTDAFWTDENDQAIDSVGYNFRYNGLAAQVPDGGVTYRMEVYFTPASGEIFKAVWEIDTIQLYGS